MPATGPAGVLSAAAGAAVSKVNKKANIHKVKDLKSAYKNEKLWNRIVNKISGKAPKWRKVAKYNSKELNALLTNYNKTGNWDGLKNKINNPTLVRQMTKESAGKSI